MEFKNKIRLEMEDGRKEFYQWDSGQRLIVYDEGVCSAVHFTNAGSQRALVCGIEESGGVRFVYVPNILLQSPEVIRAYAVIADGDSVKTRHARSFCVVKRNKPEDYVYTETEVHTFAKLAERITALENGDPVDSAMVAASVRQYMQENPIAPEEIGAVGVNQLPDVIGDALAQAKASGEFDGKDGATPVKYVDYFTEADKTEMVSAVIAALPVYNGEVVAE